MTTQRGTVGSTTLEVGMDSFCWNRQIAASELSLADVAQEAASIGCTWLRPHRNHLLTSDVTPQLAELRRICEENGQRIIWSGDGLGNASGDSEEALSHCRNELVNADEAGSPVVQFYASWFRFDEEILQGGIKREIDHIIRVLSALASEAADRGLIVALENHSNLTSEEMIDVMDAVDSPSVRVYLDVANPFPVQEDITTAVARLAPYTCAIDVKDIYIRSNWATNAWHRHGYTVYYTWPGRGFLPWPAIWQELGRGIPMEHVPLIIEGLDESSRPLVDAEEAIGFMADLSGAHLRRHGE